MKTDTSSLVRTAALVLTLTVATFGAASSTALDHVNTSDGLTLAGAPLAIHGYDPVAYFTDGEAQRGKAEFVATHDGAAYRFTSAANQRAFEKDPERYAPQYGGFCAFGVALGAKFDGDPEIFAVVDDRLYLNLNPEIQGEWNQDVGGNIEKADQSWTQIRTTAPSALGN